MYRQTQWCRLTLVTRNRNNTLQWSGDYYNVSALDINSDNGHICNALFSTLIIIIITVIVFGIRCETEISSCTKLVSEAAKKKQSSIITELSHGDPMQLTGRPTHNRNVVLSDTTWFTIKGHQCSVSPPLMWSLYLLRSIALSLMTGYVGLPSLVRF